MRNPDRKSRSINSFYSDPDLYDEDSGLYYYKARYYHAGLGRFLSIDPVGHDDQMNLYAYVANAPMLYRDPRGGRAEGTVYGYGGGIYSNYTTNARLAQAADREDYAKLTSGISDVLTIATPFSGPLAPYVGGTATAFSGISIVLDPKGNAKSGTVSIALEKSSQILLRKVQAPLQLGEAAISAGSAALPAVQSLASVSNKIAENSKKDSNLLKKSSNPKK